MLHGIVDGLHQKSRLTTLQRMYILHIMEKLIQLLNGKKLLELNEKQYLNDIILENH